MALRTRLTAAEVDRLVGEHPRLPADYLAYLRDVGWGTAESGHMIYCGPIAPGDVYPHLHGETNRVLIGDDTQGYCLGFDYAANRYGEYSDLGDWTSFDEDFSLASHLATRDPLRSHWSIDSLLSALSGFRRIDDGGDLLAFRVTGKTPRRSVYIYLYGDDPNLIHYDLEDESADTAEWDHAVERGAACSVEELQQVVTRWLATPD